MKKRRKIFKHLSLLMLTLSLILSGIMVIPKDADVVYADVFYSYVGDDKLAHIVTGSSSGGCANEIVINVSYSVTRQGIALHYDSGSYGYGMFNSSATSRAMSCLISDWVNFKSTDSDTISKIRNNTYDYNALAGTLNSQVGDYITNHWSDFKWYFTASDNDEAPSDPSKVKLYTVPASTTPTLGSTIGKAWISQRCIPTVSGYVQNNCTNYNSIFVPGCVYTVLEYNKSDYVENGAVNKNKLTDIVFNDISSNPLKSQTVYRQYNWSRVRGWAASTYQGKNPGGDINTFYDYFRQVYDGQYGDGSWGAVTYAANTGSGFGSVANTSWLESMAYNYDGLNMGMWSELSSFSGTIMGAVAQESDPNKISVVVGTSSWLIFNGMNDTAEYRPQSVTRFDAFEPSSWTSLSLDTWNSGYTGGFPKNRMYSNAPGMGSWGRSINNHECCNYGTTHTFSNTAGATHFGVWVMSPFITSGSNGTQSCYVNPNDTTQYGVYVDGSQPSGWVRDTSERCSTGTSCTAKASYVRVPWEWSFPNNKNKDVRAYAEIVANEIGTRTNNMYSELAADWNVMQGIPSTENISIVSGGSSILFDIGGYDVLIGIAHGNVNWCAEGDSTAKYGNIIHLNDAYSSSTKIPADKIVIDAQHPAPGAKLHDSAWNNLAVKRKIGLKITVARWWGTDNKLSTLSCPDGHVLATDSDSYPKGNPGDGDTGPKTESGTCPLCGTAYDFTSSGGEEHVDDDPSTEEDESKPATANSWDGSHSCSYELTFHCNTGTYTYLSEVDGVENTTNYIADSHITDSNQGYYSNSNNFTHGTKTIKYDAYEDPGTIDDGYTTGTGCTSDHHQNLFNFQNKSAEFLIYECIDQYSYSRLTNYVVYGLTHNTLSEVNETLIDKSSCNNQSGSALSVAVRGLIINTTKTEENKNSNIKDYVKGEDGHYESGNGRLWFTQNNFGWMDVAYGITGEEATTYANQKGKKNPVTVSGLTAGANLWENNETNGFVHNIHFSMGNTTFALGTFACDSVIGKLPNPDVVDELSVAPVHGRGAILHNYYSGTGTGYLGAGPTGVDDKATTPDENHDWTKRDVILGDMCTETELDNQILQLVNAWQNYMNTVDGNNGLYTVSVVSDGLTAGFNGSIGDPYDISQKLCGNYSQIDKGIRLYNSGFRQVASSCDGDLHTDGDYSEIHYRYHENLRSFDDTLTRGHEDADVGEWNTTVLQGYSGDAVEDVTERYKKPNEYSSSEVATSVWEEDYILKMSEQKIAGVRDDGYVLTHTKIYSVQDLGENPKVMYGLTQYTVGSAEEYPYHNTISPGETKETGNFYVYTVTEEDSRSKETFDGYWRKHEYPNKGTFNIVQYVNGTKKSVIATVSESGDLNARNSTVYKNADSSVQSVATPGVPLVMSNIKLNWNAPNGVYTKPLAVNNMYTVFLEVGKGGSISPVSHKNTPPAYPYGNSGKYSTNSTIKINGVSKTEYKCTYYKDYENYDGDVGEINDIVVHDPVASQYSILLPNNTGAYSDGVIDETNEDFRVTHMNIAEVDKPGYIVMGNTFHILFSDVGDFYDSTSAKYGYGDLLARGIGAKPNTPTTGQGYGCNPLTGEINKNVLGFVDKMNTSRWTKARYVQFSFPVSYTDIEGKTKYLKAYDVLDLSTVMGLTDTGAQAHYIIDSNTHAATAVYGNVAGLFHAPSVKLRDYADKHGDEVMYGLDFEFKILTSSLETTNAEVRFFSEAINTPSNETITNTDGLLMTTNKVRYNSLKDKTGNQLRPNASYHRSDKYDYVEVVGRIGNLAIEDTADFRFSNLFKKAEDTWLIAGVIKNTDITKPNTIISTRNDILGDNAMDNNGVAGKRHNTLSATAYLIGSSTVKSSFQFGKAGPFELLPLSSTYNPIPEYRKQLMRLGYNAYLDIETIGNYYGMNADKSSGVITRYRGPMNTQEAATREWGADGNGASKWVKKMTIIPHYFLYDPDEYDEEKHPYERGFYGIDIYGGSNGNRSLVWSETSHITDPYELYIDLRSGTEIGGEVARRNVTNAEMFITDKIAKNFRDISEDLTVFDDTDFIGTASLIELDYKDKSFIGTSWYDGAVYKLTDDDTLKAFKNQSYGYSMLGENEDSASNVSHTPSASATLGRIDPTAFGEQSQRWYFTLGLPSSSYLTNPTNIGKDQNAIEDSHSALLEAHPNGVVVVFLDIEVTGDVWQLKYDAISQHANSEGEITFTIPDLSDPNNPDPTPIPVKLPEDPEDPERYVRGDGQPRIDPTWIPVIVYDKEWNSTYDLATYGTH